jgi:hypothetical protein
MASEVHPKETQIEFKLAIRVSFEILPPLECFGIAEVCDAGTPSKFLAAARFIALSNTNSSAIGISPDRVLLALALLHHFPSTRNEPQADLSLLRPVLCDPNGVPQPGVGWHLTIEPSPVVKIGEAGDAATSPFPVFSSTVSWPSVVGVVSSLPIAAILAISWPSTVGVDSSWIITAILAISWPAAASSATSGVFDLGQKQPARLPGCTLSCLIS